MSSAKAIVLAAGKGSRLHSDEHILPKVLREANGKALLDYVLQATGFISQEDTILVVGYKSDLVVEHVGGEYRIVEQHQQLGTGHAVKMAEFELKHYSGPVLVVYGDMPLFSPNTYQSLLKVHRESRAACTLLTAVLHNPPEYGRVIRDEKNEILDIREVKDCTGAELAIKELNSGVYVFDAKKLFAVLRDLKNDNAQGEYYLTDVPKHLLKRGDRVASYTLVGSDEVYGVNTLDELKLVESLLKKRGIK